MFWTKKISLALEPKLFLYPDKRLLLNKRHVFERSKFFLATQKLVFVDKKFFCEVIKPFIDE